MLRKSLIQVFVDGLICVPSLLFTWGLTMVEVMKIMETSYKRSHACTAPLSAPNPAAGHHQPTPMLETPGHTQANLGQSLVRSLLLFPASWCTRFCLCPPRVYFSLSLYNHKGFDLAVHAWDLLKEVTIIFITSTIVRPQVNSREGTQPTQQQKIGLKIY